MDPVEIPQSVGDYEFLTRSWIYPRCRFPIRTQGEEFVALWESGHLFFFAPRSCARRRWCLHWTPFTGRWWISLGFPTWKRSIQLISDCNRSHWGAAALGGRSSTPTTFGLRTCGQTHGSVGALDRSTRDTTPGAPSQLYFPFFLSPDTDWIATRFEELFQFFGSRPLKRFIAAESARDTQWVAFTVWILTPTAERVPGLHGPYLK